jgi:heme A synthase
MTQSAVLSTGPAAVDHRLAVMTSVLTFALLLLGGVVHGTGSSLACPDWPTCFGELMPPMTGGVLYEHSHRMLGTAVGLCTCALAAMLHLTRERPLRLAGYAAVALVVIQGVLGGITVLLRLPTAVSTAHLAVAMLFFCTLLWIVHRTSPTPCEAWHRASRFHAGTRLRRWALGASLAVYAQILLGGLVRHTGGALACIDIPLCHDEFWPADGHITAQLHMLHRYAGLAVVLLVAGFALVAWRTPGAGSPPRRHALVAVLLAIVQILLGVSSVSSGLNVAVVTAHLGGAAALLGVLAWTTFCSTATPATTTPLR